MIGSALGPPRTIAIRHRWMGVLVDKKKRLLVSVVAGAGAAILFALYAMQMQGQIEQERRSAIERYGGESVATCVATRDIDPGETLDETNVRVEEWVGGLLPDEPVLSLRDAVGRTATSAIPKRAPISSVYFERRDSKTAVPKGSVAVAVSVDSEHAVGGALERGETVDVYLTKDAVASRLCSADVLDTSVLANGGGSLEWVTLAISEENAREVLAATTAGSVSLAKPASAAKDKGDE